MSVESLECADHDPYYLAFSCFQYAMVERRGEEEVVTVPPPEVFAHHEWRLDTIFQAVLDGMFSRCVRATGEKKSQYSHEIAGYGQLTSGQGIRPPINSIDRGLQCHATSAKRLSPKLFDPGDETCEINLSLLLQRWKVGKIGDGRKRRNELEYVPPE